MKGQILQIKFLEDKVFLTEEVAMSFEQLGLTAHRSKGNKPSFWVLRVLNYAEKDEKIFCEIVDYKNGETEFSDRQKLNAAILNKIKSISFNKIDTEKFVKTLERVNNIHYRPTSNFVDSLAEEKVSIPALKLEALPVYIDETFYVSLNDLRFILGGVSFQKKFKGYPKSIELTISNYDILVEFDAIKNYFVNIFGAKKIKVFVKLEIKGDDITVLSIFSPEINKINRETIDTIKFEFVKKSLKKKPAIEIDKSLFTMDEYFEMFGDEKVKSDTFYKNDRELFEDLISISQTKHYKHLRYLSSRHAHTLLKLRFVHKPISFLFLIEGDRNYHLIWETLDTREATYIWHIDKSLAQLKISLRHIEDIINIIKVQGKTAYLNSADEPFRRIYHDYSELVDGFVKWKGELESWMS